MRVAFFGSGSPFSAAALREVAGRYEIGILFELRRLGRRDRLKRLIGRLAPTPLAAVARELRLHLTTYRHEDSAEDLRNAGVDLIVIASFPAILPPAILQIPGINLHTSLLPRHRGIDPLFWTYHADDRESGTTVHWLDGGVDRGDILSQRVMPLVRGYPMLSLYDDLSRSGSVQLAEAIDAIESGVAARIPQDASVATDDPAPSKRTWRVEFDSWPAERTWHFVNGVGQMYGSICRDPAGADMPVGASASYTLKAHGRCPGTWERTGDGSAVLYCPDGIVTALP
jgi:methionyl-tRNA formyltransferase